MSTANLFIARQVPPEQASEAPYAWVIVATATAYTLSCLAQTAVVFWFTQTSNIGSLFALSLLFGFGFAGVMTCLLICAREAAPIRLSGTAMAIVSTTAWVGMGIGSYQAGYLYDLNHSYALSYGNAAVAGIINLAIVFALAWYRSSRTSAPARSGMPAPVLLRSKK